MERKIGETFEFEGKKLQVKEDRGNICNGCFFDTKCTNRTLDISGNCDENWRNDQKSVMFVEVTEEQKPNLCEILKYCPQGEMFWSPLLGDVKLFEVNQRTNGVFVTTTNLTTWRINPDATMTINGDLSPEIMLYPSKEQRDWTKVKYEPKKGLPRTWEEFCKNYPIKKVEYFLNTFCELHEAGSGNKRQEKSDRNILPSLQAVEAHLALIQLHQLRDAWREGWLPDWTNKSQSKYVIYNHEGELIIMRYCNTHRFLSFQDKERAREFLECFRDLIEQAGDLI